MNKTKKIGSVVLCLMLAVVVFAMASPVQAEITQVPVCGLYAGGTNPGVVYKYAGGTNWEAISPELGYSVLSLVKYDSKLYAGTKSNQFWNSTGQVYRYDGVNDTGSHIWTLVGDNMDNMTNSLEVYKGDLYAGTSWNHARLYRYNPTDENWTKVVDYSGWSGIRSMYVWDKDNVLYLGDHGMDYIGRYNGTAFVEVANLGGSCIWDFASYNETLYASAYMGRIHNSSDGINWIVDLDWGLDRNIWEMEVFQDYLYYGTDWMYMGDQEAQLWKYDGSTRTKVWNTSVSNYCEGIISMATDGNLLFIGMGGEPTYFWGYNGTGEVYSYDGTNDPQLISSTTMGTGVQVLYYVVCEEGKVTGGGWIPAPEPSKGKNNKATFGFVAHYKDGETEPSGNLEFFDHAIKMNVHTESIDTLTVSGNKATFTGTARVNGESGYSFTVDIEDNGEPGKGVDKFAIAITDAVGNSYYSAGDTLGGGNIQIHK